MAKKYHVTRIVSLVQSTVIKANSPEDAIAAARKSKFKDWATVDNKRRSGYEAKEVKYSR